MADRQRKPAVLVLTVLLAGVAMPIAPVEAYEAPLVTAGGAAQTQGPVSRGPAAGSPLQRLPPIGPATSSQNPEKIAAQRGGTQTISGNGVATGVTAESRLKSDDFVQQTAHRPDQSGENPTPAAMTTPAWRAGKQAFPELTLQPSRVTPIVVSQYQRAMSLAEKGALYAAEEQLVQTLWLIAQSGDKAAGSPTHVEALAAALQAWREAEDLAPALSPTTTAAQVAHLIAMHRTPLPTETSEGTRPAVDVLQAYYAYSQEQLLHAVGHEPAASQVLYGLGRLQTAPSRIPTSEQRLARAKGIVMFQSALAVDRRNYAAANELGVLLARCGRLDEAKAAFHQAVSVTPAMESWKNLATVGERLGDVELARQAHLQYQAALERRAQGEVTPSSGIPEIRWVAPAMFAGAPPEAATAVQQPLVAPTSQPTAEPKKIADGGFKSFLDWLSGRNTTGPTPPTSSPPAMAVRDVPNHLVR